MLYIFVLRYYRMNPKTRNKCVMAKHSFLVILAGVKSSLSPPARTSLSPKATRPDQHTSGSPGSHFAKWTRRLSSVRRRKHNLILSWRMWKMKTSKYLSLVHAFNLRILCAHLYTNRIPIRRWNVFPVNGNEWRMKRDGKLRISWHVKI